MKPDKDAVIREFYRALKRLTQSYEDAFNSQTDPFFDIQEEAAYFEAKRLTTGRIGEAISEENIFLSKLKKAAVKYHQATCIHAAAVCKVEIDEDELSEAEIALVKSRVDLFTLVEQLKR